VLSPAIKSLESVPGLSCSCKSDGTASNIGGDAVCDLKIGPPPGVDALKDMKITFHAGTTVRPCAKPAMASVVAGISLPVLSSTEEVCSVLGGSCTDNDSLGGGSEAVHACLCVQARVQALTASSTRWSITPSRR
jgi:hypothetical protein